MLVCPHCKREFKILKWHVPICKRMPPPEEVRKILDSDPSLSVKRLSDELGVQYHFTLKFMRDFGMGDYINKKPGGRQANPSSVPDAKECPNCGRHYTRITRHRNVCDKMPTREELGMMFENDEALSVEAFTRRFGISSQFVCDTLRYYGMPQYIGRTGVKKMQFQASLETETDARCTRCKIKIFDKVPTFWEGEGMEKTGDLCARCAEVSNADTI